MSGRHYAQTRTAPRMGMGGAGCRRICRAAAAEVIDARGHESALWRAAQPREQSGLPGKLRAESWLSGPQLSDDYHERAGDDRNEHGYVQFGGGSVPGTPGRRASSGDAAKQHFRIGFHSCWVDYGHRCAFGGASARAPVAWLSPGVICDSQTRSATGLGMGDAGCRWLRRIATPKGADGDSRAHQPVRSHAAVAGGFRPESWLNGSDLSHADHEPAESADLGTGPGQRPTGHGGRQRRLNRGECSDLSIYRLRGHGPGPFDRCAARRKAAEVIYA